VIIELARRAQPGDNQTASPGDQPASRPRRLLHDWGVEVAVLGVAGVGLPIALAVHYKTFGTPVSDDWAYALAVFHLARTGRLFLYHWITINFVGQALLALPVVVVFGPRIAPLDAWTCCVGFCGLLAICHLARSLGLSRPVALALGVGVALTPVWLEFSTSFMTDIPAISLMMLALALLAADRRSDRYVTSAAIAALAAGFVAFTIRETTAPVLVAIVVARAWRNGRPRRQSLGAMRGWVLVSGAFAVAAVSEYAWRHVFLAGEGYQPPPALHPRLLAATFVNGWVWPLAGLLLLPVACYLGGPQALHRLWAAAPGQLIGALSAVPGILLVAHVALVEHTWFSSFTPPAWAFLSALVLPLGNQGFDLSPLGAGGAERWVLIGLGALLSVLALVGWGLLTATTLERLRARRDQHRGRGPQLEARRAVAITAAVSAGLFASLYSLQFPLYERDAMIWMVPAAIVLAASRTARLEPDATAEPALPYGPARRYQPARQATAVLAAVAIGAVSVLASARVDATEGTSWSRAEAFARAHPALPAADISAGWVWDSYHAGTYRSEPRITCYQVVSGAAADGVADDTTVSVPLDVAPDQVGVGPASRPLPADCT
jgi:hypothetical protein